jgi:hypothetical protein
MYVHIKWKMVFKIYRVCIKVIDIQEIYVKVIKNTNKRNKGFKI